MSSVEGGLLLVLLTLCGGMVLNKYLSSETLGEKEIETSKTILRVVFSLCLIWPFVNFAVYLLHPDGQILVGTWGTGLFFQIVLNFPAFAAGVFLCVFRYQLQTPHKGSDQLAMGLKIAGLAVLLLVSNGFCALLDEGKYYTFSSPNQAHTIVVHEMKSFQIATITVYERINPLLVCERGVEDTNKTMPLAENDYAVQWHENSVAFSFGDGEGGQKSISVSFDAEK